MNSNPYLPYIVMGVVLAVISVVAVALLFAHSRRKDEAVIRTQEETIANQDDSIESLKLRLGNTVEGKDKAYEERNTVAVLMARSLMAAGVVGEGLDKWQIYRSETPEFVGWEPVIYFVPPVASGLLQMSWHFTREQVWMLESLGLPEAPANFWDGRTREQKYENIKAYLTGA